jgi:hypothetical protein
MPVDPSKLKALVEAGGGTADEGTPAQVLLPEPWGVVYTPPNPDASRKSCGNCMMWVDDDVCGYHIYGEPMAEWMGHPGMQPVQQEYSGLETVEGGTSCDSCRYYDGDEVEGTCRAVIIPGSLAPVQALGCCARWESVGE